MAEKVDDYLLDAEDPDDTPLDVRALNEARRLAMGRRHPAETLAMALSYVLDPQQGAAEILGARKDVMSVLEILDDCAERLGEAIAVIEAGAQERGRSMTRRRKLREDASADLSAWPLDVDAGHVARGPAKPPPLVG